MARIVTLLSGKAGTGKTTLAAMLGVILAADRVRVTLVDADLYTPGLNALFGAPTSERGFLDLLNGLAADPEPVPGHPHLSLLQVGAMEGLAGSLIRETFPLGGIPAALAGLAERADTDLVLVDTHAGLFEASLLAACVSDVVLLPCLAESQHLQATAVLLGFLGELGVDVRPVVNRVPAAFDMDVVQARIAEVLGVMPFAVLPDSALVANTAGAAFPLSMLPLDSMLESTRDLASRIRLL